MTLVRRSAIAWLTLLSSGSLGAAEIEALHNDAAARIDYGFYIEEPGLIRAAREALAGSPNAWSAYLRAYASYREASLMLARGRAVETELSTCIEEAQTAALDPEVLVEANVLVAACSALLARMSPLRAVLYQRRHEQALAEARAHAPENPRLLLIEQTTRRASDTPSRSLERVLTAFRAMQGYELPSWGEAEVLVLLAGERLAMGDLRAARDFVEQALLIARDYNAALEIERRIRNASNARP